MYFKHNYNQIRYFKLLKKCGNKPDSKYYPTASPLTELLVRSDPIFL